MMAADMDDWKLVRLNKVRRAEIVFQLVQANISLTEFGEQWSDDEATIEATKLAGRQAAEEIAHKEFEELIHTTLSGSNLSRSAVQESGVLCCILYIHTHTYIYIMYVCM